MGKIIEGGSITKDLSIFSGNWIIGGASQIENARKKAKEKASRAGVEVSQDDGSSCSQEQATTSEGETVRSVLLEGMPNTWKGWPCEVEVSFTVTEICGVHGGLYKEYAVDTCEEAARNVFDPKNKGIFVSYRLHTIDVVPLFEWFVTWPALRRGSDDAFARLGSVEAAAPSDIDPDDTLCQLFNHPLSMTGYETRYMLKAGGRTKEDARQNWDACARAFRKIYREIRSRESDG